MGVDTNGGAEGHWAPPRTMKTTTYRVAVALAVAAALLPLWMYGAVATENDSPGPMFFGPVVVGIIGALIARFRPQGVVRALFAAALAQALFAVIAMIAWQQYVEISVLNGFLIALWVGAAMLFRQAARVSFESGAIEQRRSEPSPH